MQTNAYKDKPDRIEQVTVKGFMRLCLTDVSGKHKGRKKTSPWMVNAITATGFQDYIVQNIGSNLSGTPVAFLQLATQTDAPTSAQTSASGEFEARASTSNSFVADGTLQATASWDTDEATQSTLGAIAIYNTSSGGSAGSVATFTTSDKTTDQTLSATYQWRFS